MVPHARVIETELAGRLSDDNRHRLERVMRLREGDSFVVTDGLGHETTAVLGKSGTYHAPTWETPGREPEVETTLFAAISKGERLEWLIEKAVEMGVFRIVPLIAERCVVKILVPAKSSGGARSLPPRCCNVVAVFCQRFLTP